MSAVYYLCDVNEYRDGDWWLVEHVKNRVLRGYIPANYVVEVKEVNSFKTSEYVYRMSHLSCNLSAKLFEGGVRSLV